MLVKKEVVENVTKLKDAVAIRAEPKKHNQCDPNNIPVKISQRKDLLLKSDLIPFQKNRPIISEAMNVR